jgi:hypothetical protein
LERSKLTLKQAIAVGLGLSVAWVALVWIVVQVAA